MLMMMSCIARTSRSRTDTAAA